MYHLYRYWTDDDVVICSWGLDNITELNYINNVSISYPIQSSVCLYQPFAITIYVLYVNFFLTIQKFVIVHNINLAIRHLPCLV